MILKMLYYIVLVVCVLVGVAFLTLLERKVLGYIQIRKGPNKVGYMGILQPFADAIKLFSSENTYPMVSNFMPYYISPILGMFLSLIAWVLFPSNGGVFDFSLGLIFFLCLVGCSVYPIMGSGWFSNSKYALLGCLRSVAQTISYEVSLAIKVICIMVLVKSYSFFSLGVYQVLVWFVLLIFPLSTMWVLIMLAETNRTPFDFAEGESELVSGFNIEYSGGGFALIFMAEYSSILFMSLVYSLFFFGGVDIFLSFKIFFFSFFFVFIRGLLPRLRYDKLMYLAWKDLLPLTLGYLCLLSSYVWLFMNLNKN
uniref:NADH-ubiquinone oxidoreductase chain 1 n=1 Tax=Scolopocryptops sp. 1 YG-2013 TaxID=1285684 RepID=R4IVA4_9MYRI|nr:NAHD dehydrogenase subunit 1 [Scolopocryptops sp. 1 YG-2013]